VTGARTLRRRFDPPVVATIFPLRSRYAEDLSKELVDTLVDVLSEKKYLTKKIPIPDSQGAREINLEDYIRRYPVRKHRWNWIDDGERIGGVHPDTALPFFINRSGSRICRLCDGRNTTGDILFQAQKMWGSVPRAVLLDRVMSFILLLDELDLIGFARKCT